MDWGGSKKHSPRTGGGRKTPFGFSDSGTFTEIKGRERKAKPTKSVASFLRRFQEKKALSFYTRAAKLMCASVLSETLPRRTAASAGSLARSY